jgi:translation initiation factor 1
MGICPICGLPEELCSCDSLEQEGSLIKVRVEHRRYNKPATVIEGINPKNNDLHKMAKKLKSWLACGGTVKDNKIILLGDHRGDIPRYLEKLGFSKESIQIL